MSTPALKEFLQQLTAVRELFYIMTPPDIDVIKPEMSKLLKVMVDNLDCKEAFIEKLKSLIDELPNYLGFEEKKFIIYTIDYTMRSLRWTEIEGHLKQIYPKIEDSAVSLEVEKLIRIIFDPKWPSGVCERIDEDINMWDL